MKRICIFGNSHVGALKEGVDSLNRQGALNSVDITIFGSHRDSLKECVVSDGVITSDSDFVRTNFRWTSNGQETVNVTDFDEIYVVAGQSFFFVAPFLTRSHLPPLSDTIIEDIMTHRLDGWDMQLARAIAEASPQTQVTHLGEPFFSDEHPRSLNFLREHRRKGGQMPARLDKVQAQLDSKAQDIETENFRIAKPPEQVLEPNRVFTRHELCKDSIGLNEDRDIPHRSDDYFHMNVKYGEMVIRTLVL